MDGGIILIVAVVLVAGILIMGSGSISNLVIQDNIFGTKPRKSDPGFDYIVSQLVFQRAFSGDSTNNVFTYITNNSLFQNTFALYNTDDALSNNNGKNIFIEYLLDSSAINLLPDDEVDAIRNYGTSSFTNYY